MTTGALFQALIAQIEAKLMAAQKARNHMTTERWIEHERTTMHNAVNAIRLDMGKARVPIEHIERAERMACGHSDYSHKWAILCAEIAMDQAAWVKP